MTDGRTPEASGAPAPLELVVDGQPVVVDDPSWSLLEVLRDQLGIRTAKDGCAPQGQCGCCTVLVDGAPRVACVTPVRRVRGRSVTTAGALDDADRWADAFCATGGSQCGFCTPGIVARLSALHARKPEADHADVEQALLAHLCRCTGWRTILDAWDAYGTVEDTGTDRDLDAARRRATLEGGGDQRVAPSVALGDGGFADDTAPSEALVAMLDPDGGWTLGESVAAARVTAGKVQGRRTTEAAAPPIAPPDGDWAAALQTSWTEPAALETDASWATPGAEPASALANGGAFGAKVATEVEPVARELADEHGRAVRVRYSREDATRRGPKRPPLAAGLRADGTGVVVVARTEGVVDAIHAVLPDVEVVEVDLPGPPTSLAIRGAGWVEAVALRAALGGPLGPDGDGWVGPVTRPGHGEAWARVVGGGDGAAIEVRVDAGTPLDEVVLRSYCIGAAHQGASLVTSESIVVDDDGVVHDLTIRSFGILRAVDTPPIDVEIVAPDGEPVPVSACVVAAVAAAVWVHQGTPPQWPTGVPLRSAP